MIEEEPFFFECLLERDSESTRRKLSFIDLTARLEGIPEVNDIQIPNIDSLPLSIEQQFPYMPTLSKEIPSDLRLDEINPRELGIPIVQKQVIFVPVRRPKVGPLTREERAKKIQKYLEKKKKRTFSRKVAYHSRNIIAQKRVRVRGRFISKLQETQLLS